MSVKIRINITKDILSRSLYCGTTLKNGYYMEHTTNCAFALAVRDLFPQAQVYNILIVPFYVKDMDLDDVIVETINAKEGDELEKYGVFMISKEMGYFIEDFDSATVEERQEMEEKSFELEIPDWVINRVDIQNIINSPVLELVA